VIFLAGHLRDLTNVVSVTSVRPFHGPTDTSSTDDWGSSVVARYRRVNPLSRHFSGNVCPVSLWWRRVIHIAK
jgi:hypothetical protein